MRYRNNVYFKRHSPHIRVGCAFSLLLLYKQQYRIHMPRRLMDNLECEVIDEKFHEGTLWHDILSVYPDGEDALLLNICEHCAFGVPHNVSCFIRSERVGKVSQALLNVVSECISAFVSHLDIAVCNPHGIYRIMVMQHHRLLRWLGIEDPHGDLLSPCLSLLLQVNFYVLQENDISMRFGRTDPTRNYAIVQHPRRFPLTDMEHFIELLQGYFALPWHISSPRFHHRQGACRASSPPRPWRWRRGENKYLPSYSYCYGRDTSE